MNLQWKKISGKADMLKRINSILLLQACLLILSGCSVLQIPGSYRYGRRALRTEITGSWTKVRLNSYNSIGTEQVISGELIAIHSDTMYILTATRLESILTINISDAVLFKYRNQFGLFATLTGLLYLPDIVAAIGIGEPAFLLLGVPWLVTGGIITIAEATNHSNLFHYPADNRLTELRKYARYPQGMPAGIEKSKLHLIMTK